MDRAESLRRAVGPLRFIFWGGILCLSVVPLTMLSSAVTGERLQFRIPSDILGMVLISMGVFRLAGIEVAESYAKAMTFVKVVAVLATIAALCVHIVITVWIVVYVILTGLRFAELAAIVVFCFTMRLFCVRCGFPAAAASWRVTTVLFIVVYAIPLAVLRCAEMVALVFRQPPPLHKAAWFLAYGLDNPLLELLALLALLGVALLPLVHLFVTTSRMAREARAATG